MIYYLAALLSLGCVSAIPSGAGLDYNGSICNEFITSDPYTSGSNVPVCLVLSNETHSFKTVFYPAVDTYTLLEVDNSWSTGDYI